MSDTFIPSDAESIELTNTNDPIPKESTPEESDSNQYNPKNMQLGGMYREWYLDYASYVILERAVPHIEDGLKPVQRRILYSMHLLDNGRMSKVAKLVGATMALHPHGDQSINDALVQLGQKGYLIATQGNWGNLLTGDSAAAGRYIEAMLSNLAREVLFNDKITEFRPSYDGSTKEPVYLPVKLPLLLAQGAEGIAVGLSSRILPHNLAELLQACIDYLSGKEFVLYPDFPTGGLIDVSKYNDGRRGGQIKARANIEKIDNRTLSITELPAGKTTQQIIDSILKANDKGTIKIRRVDDLTAMKADVRIQLPAGVSSDKTIDALYAFTDCEVSISPNACVIQDDKPVFVGVSDILKYSADATKKHLLEELEIQLNERLEQYLAASLERIFIEERIYKDKEFEEAKSQEIALKHIDMRIEPYKEQFYRIITDEDLRKLLDIRMARILRFNIPKHEEQMLKLETDIKETRKNIDGITAYTIKWYQYLLDQYGQTFERMSQISDFDTIEATKVAEASEKLYINRSEGFIGTALKGSEFVCNLSILDDVIIFFRSGTYLITKVEEKKFIGKGEVIHIDRYKRNDKRTIYNAIYRNGKSGPTYIKRFFVAAMTRDRENDVTMGTAQSRILYFTANKNGEAETVRITLKPKSPRRPALSFEKDFSDVIIKGRTARGNILTKAEVSKIALKQLGASTLGGRKVWFDKDVHRLNYEGRGEFLGEFHAEDRVLVVLNNGDCYSTDISDSNHYEQQILRIEKLNANKIWTAIYQHAELDLPYLKRFKMEGEDRHNFLSDEGQSKLFLLTDRMDPRFEIRWAAPNDHRIPMEVVANEFIAVKGILARGKRLSNYQIGTIEDHSPEDPIEEAETADSPEVSSTTQAIDKKILITGDVLVEELKFDDEE